MSRRAKRDARPASARHRVTERDVKLLMTVARMRAPTTHQLRRVFFKTPSALHRRLRALHALGLLKRHAPDLNRPNIVTLTPRGARLVEEEGMSPELIHIARHVERHDPHAEFVGDLRMGFVVAAEGREDLSIDAIYLDHDLRRAVGARARDVYVPDLLVALRVAERPIVLSYEIDRGFESTSVIRRKVQVVLEMAQDEVPLYGFERPRPVILVPTLRRLSTLARHIVELGAGDLWAGGLLEAVHDPTGAHFALASRIHESTDVTSVLTARLVP